MALWVLLTVLVASAWPAVHSGIRGVLLISCLAASGWAAVTVLRFRREGYSADKSIWAAAGIVLLLGIYGLNPTHQWKDGVGLIPVHSVPGLPGTAFRSGTGRTLLLTFAILSVFNLARHLGPRSLRSLSAAAAVGGAAMAVRVLWQRLMPQPFPVFEYTGSFVNENHFAVFANLLLPVVLAAGYRQKTRALQTGRISNPSGLFYISGALLAAALIASGSRAGRAGLVLIGAAWILRRMILHRRHPFLSGAWIRWTFFLWVSFALIALAALILGLSREWPHVAVLQGELSFRLNMLSDTVRMWKSHPGWGTGPGTFSTVISYYQSEAMRGHPWIHAHCEPLQFLAEYGVWGTAILAGLAGWALTSWPKKKSLSTEIPSFGELERFGFALGLLVLALHCLVDFPLRIPLIALMAATWTGVWNRNGGSP